MEVFVILLMMVGVVLLRRSLSVENPGKFQHLMEVVVQFTQGMCEEIIGHGSGRYVAMLGTLGIFIVLCNLLGLIPTLQTPTGHIQVTLGCAVAAFLYYNFQGLRQHGVIGYLKHLCGPMLAIAIIMFPIEVIGNLGRLLSLSVRLYANMMVGDLLEGGFWRPGPYSGARGVYGVARFCLALAGVHFHALACCLYQHGGFRGALILKWMELAFAVAAVSVAAPDSFQFSFQFQFCKTASVSPACLRVGGKPPTGGNS